MRNNYALTGMKKTYRKVALGIAGLMTGMLVITGLWIWRLPGVDDLAVVVAMTACYVGAVLLLVHGHRLTGRQLAAASADQRRVLTNAHRDALTGAFTRSYFLSTLREEVKHDAEVSIGYMQIDMDHLKVLNDSGGHSTGDTALVHLIATVGRILPGAMVGRLGGDEFGIAIRGIDNKAALRRLGDRILHELGEPMQINGRPVRLSATIGVAMAPADAQDVDQLISKADLALYKGKRSGRHVTVAFDDDMLVDERHRRFIERELRAAILLNELDLHFQPILGNDGKTIRSYEALVRWQHVVRGTIMPSDFIPIAEESDLIDKLGDWVLRRACLDFDTLHAPAMSINVSAVQLRRPDFADRFKLILAETGMDGRRLVVEVTETVPMQAGSVEQTNLAALHGAGVRIAIDDFGAGYASLAYLRGFEFDIIKIDRTYVANLPASRVDGLIVSAICKIARALGLEVVAEGIETQEQFEFLQQCDCTGFQGYLLGRPAPLRVAASEARTLASAA